MYIENKKCAMLGMHIDERNKHAVVFVGMDGDKAVDFLFRPILLDSVSVLKMIDANNLVENINTLQRQYIKIMFEEKKDKAVLKDYLDINLLLNCINEWQVLMEKRVELLI